MKSVPSWEDLVNRFAEYVPFTASSLVWRRLDRASKTLLDVGCGQGRPGGIIKRHKKVFTVGADIFLPDLQSCQQNHSHDAVVQCDVRKLPFKGKSFDVVLCKEVIEHLEKQGGDELVRQLEQIARRQVIITTPVGRKPEDVYQGHASNNNPFERHRSAFKPDELRQLGYTVRGVGIYNTYGEQGLIRRFPRFLRWVLDITYVLAGPLVYFFPELAGDMFCIKNLNKGS